MHVELQLNEIGLNEVGLFHSIWARNVTTGDSFSNQNKHSAKIKWNQNVFYVRLWKSDYQQQQTEKYKVSVGFNFTRPIGFLLSMF